jgi:hypothetical protein
MSREEAERVLADPPAPMSLVTVMRVKEGARRREAQLVLAGRAADDIYEALTDFLGHRPDAPEKPPKR